MIWLLWALGCGPEPVAPPKKPPAPQATLTPVSAVDLLPQGPQRNLVIAQCTSCHSARLIAQNHMSRERWDATLSWMQQTQGLWELAPDVREPILDYLAEHFGPVSEGATDTSPWARPLYAPNPLWTDAN